MDTMTDLINRVLNKVLYSNYTGLAIVPSSPITVSYIFMWTLLVVAEEQVLKLMYMRSYTASCHRRLLTPPFGQIAIQPKNREIARAI